MQELDRMDLYWAVRCLPKRLRDAMVDGKFDGKIFVGGGYLRSIVGQEKINDVDCFVQSKEKAEQLINLLKFENEYVHKTEFAFTLPGKKAVQVIHRWVYDTAEAVVQSFDFSICCAVIEYRDKEWHSYVDDRFYCDLAAKRLVYMNPVRDEEAGGSMLRVLKYYQKGYRIPLDSLGAVMARVFAKVQDCHPDMQAKVITGLLREVDPQIDPFHIAHLPAADEPAVVRANIDNIDEKIAQKEGGENIADD